MYRTTSVLALGLFLGLAPVHAQTQSDEATAAQQDQQQTTQEQQQLQSSQQQTQQDQQQTAGGSAGLSAESMMVDTMIGSDVYSQDGEESIGSIDDVLISLQGEVEGVVVGVGGWLGVGERDVMISFDQLSLEPQEDEFRLVSRMSREELESQPEFERAEMRERREQTLDQQQPPATQDTTTMQPGTTVETDTEQRETTATQQQDTTEQGESVAELEATEEADVEQETAQQETPEQGQTAEQGETVGELQATEEADVEQETAEAERDTQQQDTMQQDTAQQQDEDRGRIVFQDEDSILASTMLGAAVRSQDDEDMGDISDIIVTLEGNVAGYVVGVGGFLGIGEKNVILTPDRIEITRDENDEVRVTALQSREDLESAPAFEGSASGQQDTMQQSEPETQQDTQTQD